MCKQSVMSELARTESAVRFQVETQSNESSLIGINYQMALSSILRRKGVAKAIKRIRRVSAFAAIKKKEK